MRRRLGPHVQVEITGLGPLLGQIADRIVSTQLKSPLAALGLIGLALLVLLGSLRVGLLALLPNLLPILATLGLMGLWDISLNITTVMIAPIALGIAVDDTIHLLHRARLETRRLGSHAAGLEQTLARVGRALVITTLVTVAGFCLLLLSSLVPARHFGVLTAVALLVALLADLCLTPVLLLWMKPWRPGGEAATGSSSSSSASGDGSAAGSRGGR